MRPNGSHIPNPPIRHHHRPLFTTTGLTGDLSAIIGIPSNHASLACDAGRRLQIAPPQSPDDRRDKPTTARPGGETPTPPPPRRCPASATRGGGRRQLCSANRPRLPPHSPSPQQHIQRTPPAKTADIPVDYAGFSPTAAARYRPRRRPASCAANIAPPARPLVLRTPAKAAALPRHRPPYHPAATYRSCQHPRPHRLPPPSTASAPPAPPTSPLREQLSASRNATPTPPRRRAPATRRKKIRATRNFARSSAEQTSA